MQLSASAAPALSVLESVRCLECSEIYSKPVAGGTVQKNPGCPACGYVGWIPLTLPQEERPRRSASGRQPIQFAPQR
jgi:hypothetical protein